MHSMARVYADVNANMPRSYWEYDTVNISWGVLENYEVVRKIGMFLRSFVMTREKRRGRQPEEGDPRDRRKDKSTAGAD